MQNVMSPENDLEHLGNRARAYLDLSENCAQSAFAALQEHFHLEAEGVLQALTPFPGLALRGETCGAVVGALMALGIVYGRSDLGDRKGYIASLPSARRFCRTFEKEHGGTSCSTVLLKKMGRAFDMTDPVDIKEYLAAGGHQECGNVVASAVQVAAKLIQRKKTT